VVVADGQAGSYASIKASEVRVDALADCPFAFADFSDEMEASGVAFERDNNRPLSLDVDPKAGKAFVLLRLFQERFAPHARGFVLRADGPARDEDRT